MGFKAVFIFVIIFLSCSFFVGYLLNNDSKIDVPDITAAVTSSNNFPCISSLREYINIQEMKDYELNLVETDLFNDKQKLKDYIEKYGGEGRLDVETSKEKVDELEMPVYVALISKKQCSSYGCDSWFEWGICEESNFKRIFNLGWM